MSEITRVPLAPVAGLGKVWLGVFACVLGGAVLAGVSMPPMVRVTTEVAGDGPTATPDQYIIAELSGQLDNGFVFQPRIVSPMRMGQMMPGFARALAQMQAGGSYSVRVPPELGYGSKAVGPIPANSPLNYHVKVIGIESEEQMRQLEMMRERMMRGGAAGPGAGGAAAGGAPGAGADGGAGAGQ